MTTKASGRNLAPLAWELCSLLEGLEVTELFGDAGLDAWFAAKGAEFRQIPLSSVQIPASVRQTTQGAL